MPLPKIKHPLFAVTLPSNNQEIMIRPFTVKEEKLFLIANSSDDFKDIFNSIKQIINNCVVAEKFDIDKCTMFDIEYLFVQLRSYSVNNIVEVTVTDSDDKKQYDFLINLNEVKINKTFAKDNKIFVSSEMGVVLRYPSFKDTDLLKSYGQEKLDGDGIAADILLKLYASCIETIFDGDSVYTTGEFTTQEAVEFLDGITIDSFNKIKEFFDNIPSLEYIINYKNSLGMDKVVRMRGLRDFFI